MPAETETLAADVVIVGSGAAGLSAAIAARHAGADVLLIEKSDKYGGTSAVSGGVVWVPNNDCMADWGVADSVEQAMTYAETLSLGLSDNSMVRTFIEQAPEVIRFIERNSDLRFKATDVLDYHEEFDGGSVRRSICVGLYPAGELGELRENLRASGHFPIPISPTDPEEGIDMMDPEVVGQRLADDMVGCGAALVAGLLKAAADKGVRLRHSFRARRLIRDGERVAGLVADAAQGPVRIEARKGVILAAGGFEWNRDLVRQFLRGPLEMPSTPPHNTGDALLMAMDVGASLGNMAEAWWMPAALIPGEEYDDQPLARIVNSERTLPGSIMINRLGRRFANEAVNYNDIGRTFHTFDPQAFEFTNLPAWIVVHQGFLDRYPFMTRFPGDPVPNWLIQAPTLRELAEKIGVDPDNLEATVARFNLYASEGLDPDFNRGSTAKQQSLGDPSRMGAAKVLGPLDQPPFYACRVYSGTIGTKGGPLTDTGAQVLDAWGQPIPGLYAAGNCAGGFTGMAYYGGGGTLGPALTFGHIAGCRAAA